MGRADGTLANKGKLTTHVGTDWRMARRAYRPTDVAALVAEKCFSVCVLVVLTVHSHPNNITTAIP